MNGNGGNRALSRFPQRKRYEVKSISERHHLMIRLIFLGWGNIRIAEALSVTPQNVSDIRCSEIVQRKLAILRAEADRRTVSVAELIAVESPENVKLLVRIRDGVEDNATLGMRKEVALKMLAMDGHGPISRVQGSILHGIITSDDVAEIKKRAVEAKAMALKDGMVAAEAEVIPKEEENA